MSQIFLTIAFISMVVALYFDWKESYLQSKINELLNKRQELLEQLIQERDK